jgi:hypothetical protein
MSYPYPFRLAPIITSMTMEPPEDDDDEMTCERALDNAPEDWELDVQDRGTHYQPVWRAVS